MGFISISGLQLHCLHPAPYTLHPTPHLAGMCSIQARIAIDPNKASESVTIQSTLGLD